MSEKSFAITSIAAAVICGTFFYPPPPVAASDDGVKVVAAPNRSAAPASLPAKTQAHPSREVAMLDLGAAPRARTAIAAATPSAGN